VKLATATKTVSYGEWLTMPIVEDAIEEVVDGEIRLMPPNKTAHAKIVQTLTAAFVRQLDESKIQIYGSTFGLVIRKEPLTCRVPDLALFIKANVVEEDGYVHSPPELVVEVLSPSNTPARVREKLSEYEAIRVPEVWVLSPEVRTVEVFRLRGNKLDKSVMLTDGPLSAQSFPEASVDVDAVWPD
jgi:Uma2 family endonuclease